MIGPISTIHLRMSNNPQVFVEGTYRDLYQLIFKQCALQGQKCFKYLTGEYHSV